MREKKYGKDKGRKDETNWEKEREEKVKRLEWKQHFKREREREEKGRKKEKLRKKRVRRVMKEMRII